MAGMPPQMAGREIRIAPHGLAGDLTVPPEADSLIVFAHGSGSSRLSPRNRQVARALNERGFATLLFDLLTPEEARDRHNVFNVELLAGRLAEAIDWVHADDETAGLAIGLFGASTGAAAALIAASARPDEIGAVVSRGGRPDLAGEALAHVSSPTLLIVGSADDGVVELNQQALAALGDGHALQLVPGATHLFEEPGALEAVTAQAADWFAGHLGSPRERA